ncbi:hypothetical protein HPP92_013175 [Vanilla planifolia]|uniref:Uncharacterized protein n=1 Tax=Vanilla planifolia TaxID=51239 RepID=A0A835QWJ6_VANPL|nr:hypothetical protein HPP92_013175 [Vanilla planifolia]
MEVEQQDCSLIVDRLEKKHGWIVAEKHLFGKSASDYDFSSRDPSKDEEFETPNSSSKDFGSIFARFYQVQWLSSNPAEGCNFLDGLEVSLEIIDPFGWPFPGAAYGCHLCDPRAIVGVVVHHAYTYSGRCFYHEHGITCFRCERMSACVVVHSGFLYMLRPVHCCLIAFRDSDPLLRQRRPSDLPVLIPHTRTNPCGVAEGVQLI